MMSYEPRELKEIHEIRQRIFQETKDLNAEERAELTNRLGNEIIEKYGLKTKQEV